MLNEFMNLSKRNEVHQKIKVKQPILRRIRRYLHRLKFNINQFKQPPLLQETRTRILLWYLALMCLFTLIAIPIIRYRLIAEVTRRVEIDMREDLEEFEEELIEILLESQAENSPKTTDLEQTNQAIYQAFDQFITTNEAEDDSYFITIVDGLFYKSNALFLPEIIGSDSDIMQHWQQIKFEEEGEM